MQLLSIEIHNFLRHKKLSFFFPKKRNVFAFTGENQAGKSTLFTAISYALYGSSAMNISKKLITHRGEKEHKVILEFQTGKCIYVIERSSSHTYLFKDGKQISATNTQKEIDKLIGCSYNTFSNCVYYKQNSASFIQIPSNLKLQFFEELFQNSELERAKEVSELEYKKAEQEYNAFKEKEQKLFSKLENIESNLTAWEERKKKAIASVKENEFDKNRLLELFNLRESQIPLEQQRNRLREQYKSLKREQNKNTREIVALEKAKCYACGQDVEKDLEKIAKLKQENKESDATILRITNEGKSLASSVWSEELEKEYTELKQKEKETEIANRQLGDYAEMIVNEIHQKGLIQTKLNKMQGEFADVYRNYKAAEKIKAMLSNKGLKRLWIESIVNVLNERISEIAAVFEAKISISIDVDKKTNPFTITFNDLPMPLPSGGATRICELVLFLAFNSIANTPFNFVILDEVFENLDTKNRQKMWDIINNIDYLSIYIISHLEIETENQFIVKPNQILKQ